MQHNQIATDAAQDNNLQPLIDQLCAPGDLSHAQIIDTNQRCLTALGFKHEAFGSTTNDTTNFSHRL